ncbi:MAG: hypothetical protein GX561_11675 [Lentisphaerae bacterium]|jgi:Tfp pilus assembly PilM family ATPase|nr:hypothetical protein [Lentisphaerota bacterium]
MKRGGENLIGLDIGSLSVKASVFQGRGSSARLVGFESFDISDEGILNDSELYRGIVDWLNSKQISNGTVCVGIPQYQTTMQVTDFPAVKPARLRELVSMETRQLGGFTDESFVHGYVSMASGHGRENPVLIGLCREQALRDTLSSLAGSGLRVGDISMSGLALANAYFNLHPGSLSIDSPVLLLELGHLNSFAVVVCGGQVLFMGSLMFRGEQFDRFHDDDLRDTSSQSPLYRAASMLDSEIQNVVEHWRSQELEPLSKTPVGKVYLSGGASMQRGLCQWLEEAFESKMELLGPEVDGVVRPDLTIAYGLGLESAGCSTLPLSLLPEDEKELRHRISRFPYAVAAAVVLVLSLFLVEVLVWNWTGNALGKLSRYDVRLSESEGLIRQIEESLSAISAHELRLAPLVEGANRGGRALSALESLGNACKDGIWIHYLAESSSYRDWAETDAKKPEDTQQEARTRGGRSNRRNRNLFGGEAPKVADRKDDEQEEFPLLVKASDIEVSGSFVCAGYAAMKDRKSFSDTKRRIGDLAKVLSEGEPFSHVDTMEELGSGHRPELAQPWTDFLRRLGGQQFMPFMLRLPYRTPEIDPVVLSQLRSGSKK